MKKSTINPVAGYILIQPQKQERTSPSGIVLPENNQEKPQQGKVLAIGESIKHPDHIIEAPCKVNDVVVYKEWGGKEVKQDDLELVLLKFEDILAIIK
jgi:chaperonin GroES